MKPISKWLKPGIKVKVNTKLGKFITTIGGAAGRGDTIWYSINFNPIILGKLDKTNAIGYVEEKFIEVIEEPHE